MSSLASRLIKAAPKSKACIVNQTDIGQKTTIATYPIPLMNLMFSGSFKGGLCFGIHQLIGDSRTFKCVDKDTPLTIYVTDEIKDKYFSHIDE